MLVLQANKAYIMPNDVKENASASEPGCYAGPCYCPWPISILLDVHSLEDLYITRLFSVPQLGV